MDVCDIGIIKDDSLDFSGTVVFFIVAMLFDV